MAFAIATTGGAKFPVGTVVKLYTTTRPEAMPETGQAPTVYPWLTDTGVTATVDASGNLAFAALAEGTFYVLAQQVSGTWQYVSVAARKVGSGALKTQSLAANGAVVIDASLGRVQQVNLAANATSSSIINPTTGQLITIEWVQDGVGGRTYSWPANCKFAGGAAPADTTANKRSSVSFWYDGTNWQEINRAVIVG